MAVPVLPPQSGVNIRVTKTLAAQGSVFSIGVALREETWEVEGFLSQTLATNDQPVAAIPLDYASTTGYCQMTCPRGLALINNELIVVGDGIITFAEGGDVSDPLPTVARICPGSCKVLYMQVGNGVFNPVDSESYCDAQEDPCTPNGVLVCGWINVDGTPQASFRRLNPVTLLPELIPGTALAYTLLPDTEVAAPTKGVTLAVSTVLNMILIGVQTATTSLIWPLKLDGVPLPLAPVTSFNDPVTNRLRLFAGTISVTIIKILISLCGEAYAVGYATGDPYSPTTPAKSLVVYAFTDDTDPHLSFGVDGIANWSDAYSVATRPNDAVLDPDGRVVVTGNGFANEGSGDSAVALTVPCLSWLTVLVQPDGVNPEVLTAPPVPFVVRFSCAGCPCVLLRGVGDHTDAAQFTWASAFVFTALGLKGVVTGDVATSALLPAQPALTMVLQTAVSGCNARIQNCGLTPVPVIHTSCQGVVEVDARVAPTTLIVNGPVVVGDVGNNAPEPTLPGAIRYHQGVFQGYDGVAWRAFVLAP
jgi:hypothetical protein